MVDECFPSRFHQELVCGDSLENTQLNFELSFFLWLRTGLDLNLFGMVGETKHAPYQVD